MRFFIALAAAAIVAGCTSSAKEDQASDAFRPLDVGSAVPAYTAVSLAGDTLRVGTSGTPMVVNVWATWCTSCREEMASLDSLQSEFGGNGLRVIGVSVDEGRVEKVKQYTETNGLQFAISHDPAGDIQRAYQVVGVPTTFIIAPDGTLLWRYTGNIAPILDDVRVAIRGALNKS